MVFQDRQAVTNHGNCAVANVLDAILQPRIRLVLKLVKSLKIDYISLCYQKQL